MKCTLLSLSPGHYVFMNAAAAPSETSSAVLESPLIPAGPYCLELYCYMYGDDVGGEFSDTNSLDFLNFSHIFVIISKPLAGSSILSATQGAAILILVKYYNLFIKSLIT